MPRKIHLDRLNKSQRVRAGRKREQLKSKRAAVLAARWKGI